MPCDPFLMRVMLKKEVYVSREQYMRLTEKPPQRQKVRNTLQKKKCRRKCGKSCIQTGTKGMFGKL